MNARTAAVEMNNVALMVWMRLQEEETKMSLSVHLCQTVEGEEGVSLDVCDAVALGDLSVGRNS